MPTGGLGAVYAKPAGAFFDLPFSGDQAGIQAALDYAGVGGSCYLGPAQFTGINNLKMYAKCRLYGSGTLATSLIGDNTGTGVVIRERTVAEGNPSGATGIIVEDLSIFAGGHTGGGLDFGNQGGPSFNSLASLRNLLVRDFASGTGIRVNSNATKNYNVWAMANQIGFNTSGGASHWDGCGSEANTVTQILTSAPWDVWDAAQLEQNGVASTYMIDIRASQVKFNGLYLALSFDTTQLVIVRSGSVNCTILEATVNDNGHNYTHTIYYEAWSAGTGKKSYIGHWFDLANGQAAHFYNQSTNEDTQFIGAALVMDSYRSDKTFTLTDAATIATDASKGNYFPVTLGGNRTMGAPTNPKNGQRITYTFIQDGTGGRTVAWNAAYKVTWSDAGNTANKRSTVSFRYDGTFWNIEGVQSTYV